MVLFDLDICKCGIEGTVTDEGTRYCFVLTQSCVEAWLNSCINNKPVHPANAFPKRLHTRISKYKKRKLHAPFYKEDETGDAGISTTYENNLSDRLTAAAFNEEGLKACPDKKLTECGRWIILVSNGFISRTSFDTVDRLRVHYGMHSETKTSTALPGKTDVV